MQTDTRTAESLIKNDRLFIYLGLIIIAALAWAYMFHLGNEMNKMDMSMAHLMPNMQVWDFTKFLLMFVMWAVMMVAMMLPSVAPAALVFAKVYRKRKSEGKPFIPLSVFLSGYFTVWTAFSLAATTAQWLLQKTALLSPMMVSTSPFLGGTLLLAAGLFQFAPLKHACLNQCRNPLDFLISEWREGAYGAFIMGVKHGYFCVGCCWMLMALLFVAGVMNLLWVAAIALFVLVEKVLPYPVWTGRIGGIFLILWGLWMLASPSIY